MLIGREHNIMLEMISKWNFKWVVVFSLLISGLANVCHAFQYTVNDSTTYEWETDYIVSIYSSYPNFSFDWSSRFFSTFLYIYNVLYFFLNYFVFLVANTCVEVTLVRKLHLELMEKKKRLDKMNKPGLAQSTNSANATPFRKRRKQEIEDRTEQRAFLMVVINTLINFILRLPELFFLFSSTENVFAIKNSFTLFFVSYTFIREFTVDLTNLTYILTFSTNFLIYYLFNLKFKQTFSEWGHFKKRN
jgi:hypothetical protein